MRGQTVKESRHATYPETAYRNYYGLAISEGRSILCLQHNEAKSTPFQRSGKQSGRVCVFDRGASAMGSALGFGVSSEKHGVLRRSHVPAAWKCAEKEFAGKQYSQRNATGDVRAPCPPGGDGLYRGMLPSCRSGRYQRSRLRAACFIGAIRALAAWANLSSFVLCCEFRGFRARLSSSAGTFLPLSRYPAPFQSTLRAHSLPGGHCRLLISFRRRDS